MVTSVQSRLGEAPEEGIKAPCVTIATGNETLFGIGQTIGGVVIADQDRVIVAAQTDSTENGIYVARGGKSWERAADFNLIDDVANGMLVADRNTGNIFLISVPNTGWNPGVDTANFILQFAPSGITWGAITGTLSNQGDLQAELDNKAALVHTHVEADITDLQPYLLDAPSDGNEYGRRDGAWVDLNLTGLYAPLGHTHVEADIIDLQDYLLDAPNDGDFYARRNLSWEMITTAAGTIGEIVMWPFEDVPENFLACDGQDYNTTTFGALFAVIGYRYGGSGPNFNVPDLRGEFIRGWANGSGRDPDRNSRTDAGDGTTGDFVGTKQAEEFKSHRHVISEITQTASSTGSGGASGKNNGSSSNTNFTGGSETRPRNVYMQFIIRYSGGGSGDASVPAVAVQDNGVELTSAVELFNFLNFNLSQPVANQIEIAFGASPNAAAFCPNYGFTFINAAVFRIPTIDATNTVFPGRRLRFVDGASNYFGIVLTSSYSGTYTEVTMSMEGADVLTNTITEWCIVNGAGGWTPISGDPFSSTPVNDITSGFIGGTKYWIAIGNAGRIAYSTDGGNTWTTSTSGTSENLAQVEYNPDSETFIAVGNGGVVCRSTDGETWTADTAQILAVITDGPGDIFGVGYDQNNVDNWVVYVRYTAAGTTGTAFSADDGLTWSAADTVVGSVAGGTSKMAPRYIAAGFNGIMFGVGEDTYVVNSASDNTAAVIYNTSGDPGVNDLASIYALGTTQDAIVKGNQLNDGNTNFDDTTMGISVLNGVVWSETLERLVMVGEDSKIMTYELADFDGGTRDFGELQANGGNPLADYLCVHWDPDDGIFCAGNNQGQIVRSVNGLGQPVTPIEYTGFTLIAADPFTGTRINRIMSGNIAGTIWWVAIGPGGLLFTSTDAGVTWTQRTTGTTNDLICVAYNSTNQQFVVGAAGGVILDSTDGTTWNLDNTGLAGLGGTGPLDVRGLQWDSAAGLWWCEYAHNPSVTGRTATFTAAIGTFTGRDTSSGMTIPSVYGKTSIDLSAKIHFPFNSSSNFGIYNGAIDTVESTFASITGGQAICVASGPGTGGFTNNHVMGFGDGGFKRYGSDLSGGTNRGFLSNETQLLASARINSIAYSSLSSRWLAVCDQNEIYVMEQSSFDAPRNVWAIVNNPFTGNITDCHYDPTDNLFIAVGDNGEIGRSTDGIS